MSLYPWQAAQWSNIQRAWKQGRLAHALLLTGPEGMGKRHFGDALAKALLCQNRDPDQTACGQCRSCQLFNSTSHPDFVELAPEEEGKQIGVEQVRALTGFVSLKSQIGLHKSILVKDAQMMNNSAANAFLKTLEEPNDNTYLVLITDQPAKLLPTIRSRCQFIAFAADRGTGSEQWLKQALLKLNIINCDPAQLLQMAAGAPLQALKYAQNGMQLQIDEFAKSLQQLSQNRLTATQAATLWLKRSSESDFFVLDWYYLIIHSQLLSSASVTGKTTFSIPREVSELIGQISQQGLFHFMDEIKNSKRAWSTQVNRQLLLEGLFLRWQNLYKEV